MTYRKVTKPTDVREELRESAAAALAVGMDVQEFRVRDLTVLHVDGKIFQPHRNLDDALKLLFHAQMFSVGGHSPVVRLAVSAYDTRVQIGAGRWHVYNHEPSPGHAMRAAILEAFAGQYHAS